MATASASSRSRKGVTALLIAWSAGDQSALDALIPIVHGELRHLARHLMRGERGAHTLQTTALVNEAYMRLVDLTRVRWQDRAHFFAMSAKLMRRILVDHARSRKTLLVSEPAPDLIALDDALAALAEVDPRKSQVVELRFFGGLSIEEAALALHVSCETVTRDWRFAKTWIMRELRSR
jgi:DNA-directed RNA polymerase specialized sigma24 family protein